MEIISGTTCKMKDILEKNKSSCTVCCLDKYVYTNKNTELHPDLKLHESYCLIKPLFATKILSAFLTN